MYGSQTMVHNWPIIQHQPTAVEHTRPSKVPKTSSYDTMSVTSDWEMLKVETAGIHISLVNGNQDKVTATGTPSSVGHCRQQCFFFFGSTTIPPYRKHFNFFSHVISIDCKVLRLKIKIPANLKNVTFVQIVVELQRMQADFSVEVGPFFVKFGFVVIGRKSSGYCWILRPL